MSENDRETIVTNPLHNTDERNESFDLEQVDINHLPDSSPYTTNIEDSALALAVKDHDPEGDGHNDGHGHGGPAKPSKVPMWIQDYIEPVFKVKKRKTTIELEIYCGVVQFISCLYVLPVVPFQMKRAGYDETASIIATAVTCCIGCIAASFLTDMPLIIAPPTSVSIFLAVSVQQQGFTRLIGNSAVVWSGVGLTIVGAVPPISRFVTKLIPECIQASTAIGIGLITALAGATELEIVVRGQYTIVDMGPLTPEVLIGIASLIVVAVLLHFHVKGAFCGGLVFGTFIWWIISGEWPKALVADPAAGEKGLVGYDGGKDVGLLVFNLLFLYILTLNGLARSMSDLAGLTKKSGAIPRAGFLYIVCGLTTILSGYLSGPPILISPESAAGIKAGAKTGLSTLVCGILFGISVFFYPVFAAVPAPGTAPLLIIVGVILFANVKRVDWTEMRFAVPAYVTLFFIPFTYSILRGVAFGYVIFLFIGLFTGDVIANMIDLYHFYSGYIPAPLRLPASLVPEQSLNQKQEMQKRAEKKKHRQGGDDDGDDDDFFDDNNQGSGGGLYDDGTGFGLVRPTDDETGGDDANIDLNSNTPPNTNSPRGNNNNNNNNHNRTHRSASSTSRRNNNNNNNNALINPLTSPVAASRQLKDKLFQFMEMEGNDGAPVTTF